MSNWVSNLFSRKARSPKITAEAPVAAPPFAASSHHSKPAAAAPAVPVYFLEAVTDFGFQDFFTQEREIEPHQLQFSQIARDNYMHRFCDAARDLLRYGYAEGEAYSQRPDYEWSQLSPKLAEFLAAQTPETSDAFKLLLKLAKKHSKSVAELEVDPAKNCRVISFAKNGMSNAEAAELKDALDKIWKALPESDPRMVEGFEYVMETRPAVAAAFPHYWWTRNDRRSDYHIAEKLETSSTGTALSLKQASAIASQTADNLAQLKPVSRELAEKTLSWCLSRTLDIDPDYRMFDGSRKTAAVILDALAGGSTIAEQAKAIEDGTYGRLKGKVSGTKEEMEERQWAVTSAAAAPVFLAVVQEISSGAWFDTERARLLALADKALWTPEMRAQKERERKDEIVQQVAADATVLSSAVHVGGVLRLKHAKPGG